MTTTQTPKQKADELLKMIFEEQHTDDRAKMICLSTKKIGIKLVEEIIKSVPMHPTYKYDDGKVKYKMHSEDYWECVKEEIEKS